MGLFEMLLGEEEAKKLRKDYKGRDADIPAHITSGDYSMAFEGHPYMQMPGARGLLEAQVQAQVPSPEETVAPWDERITEEPYYRGETFLQEGGPYYREGIHPNPNIPPEVRQPPQMPWDQQIVAPMSPGRPQPAPEYPIPNSPMQGFVPQQNIGGAITPPSTFTVDPRMEAMKQMRAMQEMQRMQEMQAMQAMRQMPNSAMQGFAPPMGGAY